MGKVEEQQPLPQQTQDRGNGCSSWLACQSCSIDLTRIRRAFSLKCLFVLVLSASVLLSGLFWIPPFHIREPGFRPTDVDTLNATVQAYFRLQKPVSVLVAHIDRLEYDILTEIGMPNTKVSIISMHKADASNWTDVVFGVLSVPKDVPISSVSLSVLKSSLIELALRQSDLSLTASIFGWSSSFEILKFPGGITVIPAPLFIWQIPQILFNFTLYNKISQIRENFDQFKQELKFGLHLRSHESVYIQVTNTNGSTVDVPVTVEASVLSDVGNHIILPERLKQLAHTITRSPPVTNLGLDHVVFGSVKGVSLSSYMNLSLQFPTPSPSPSPSAENNHLAPSVSPYPAPAPSHSSHVPVPSADCHGHLHCFYCITSPPSENNSQHAPTENSPQSSPPSISKPPATSPIITHSPRRSPCDGLTTPTNPSDPSPASSVATPYAANNGEISQLAPDQSPLPSVSNGPNAGHPRRSRKISVSPSPDLPLTSSSSSSYLAGSPQKKTWLLGFLGSLIFYNLLGTS